MNKEAFLASQYFVGANRLDLVNEDHRRLAWEATTTRSPEPNEESWIMTGTGGHTAQCILCAPIAEVIAQREREAKAEAWEEGGRDMDAWHSGDDARGRNPYENSQGRPCIYYPSVSTKVNCGCVYHAEEGVPCEHLLKALLQAATTNSDVGMANLCVRALEGDPEALQKVTKALR
jgi:hypothetical protein